MFRTATAIFFAALLLIIVLKAPLWTVWICCGLFLAAIVWGSFEIRLNFFLKSLSKTTDPDGKIIALTFDDGPTELTPQFLKTLKNADAKATFFCIGKQIEKHPDILAKILTDGHEIGNHTYSHLNRTGFMSINEMVSEIASCDAALEKAAHIKTTLYRPPFGVTNPNIAKAVRKTGKISVGWSVRSLDTVIQNEQQIASRVLRSVRPGSIILMHDTTQKSLKALQILLLNLKQQGYRFVTVSSLLNLKH